MALAIFRALQLNRKGKGDAKNHVEEILQECVEFSKYDINIQKAEVQNKFDETCQGTVPVALWIIGRSNGFEDAVRQAVSLGADADTLGAIVGSMAEAIWGIPKAKCLETANYLPEEILQIIEDFYSKVQTL